MLFLKTILFFASIYVTGPSSISVEIRPIGINDSGEVLCKTRFSQNEWGAYRQMDVFYGYCIVSKDSIIEYKYDSVIVEIDEDWEVVAQKISEKDSIYNLVLNLKKANDLELRLVRDNLFRPIKLITQEYSIVSLDQIQTQVESTTQRTIRNAKSMTYVSQTIQIVFETDKVIFVQNLVNHDLPEDELFGAEFNFPNYIKVENNKTENLGFDIQEVTGILTKK